MKKKQFGNLGEKLAAKYLKEKNYAIIEKNFTISGGEIDIIAKKNDAYIFVEVKTRQNESWQEIEETLTDLKINFVTNAAEEWLLRQNLNDVFWQIDFIGIILESNEIPTKIVHLEDV